MKIKRGPHLVKKLWFGGQLEGYIEISSEMVGLAAYRKTGLFKSGILDFCIHKKLVG